MTIRIFRHYLQLALAVVAVVELLVFFGASFVVSKASISGSRIATNLGSEARDAVVYAVVLAISAGAVGLYHARQRSGLAGLLTRIAFAVTAGSIIYAAIAAVAPAIEVTLLQLLLSASVAFGGALTVRLTFEYVVDDELFKRRVLVYGAGKRAESIAQLRRRADRRGFVVLGYVATESDRVEDALKAKTLTADVELLEHCRALLIDEIVVAMDDRRRSFPMYQLLECRLEGVEVTELVTFLERETGKVRLDVLNPSWFIFSEGFHRGRLHTVLERLFDIFASLGLLLLTLPVMLLTILAIKLEDGSRASILYRQTRVGRYGKGFSVLKFRSMREDAEREGKAVWAMKNDSRVTRVGAVIRKTRIDELPQILNVLRGEMSFVGPRPERPEFVSRLSETIPYYRERHTLKPGITGWAQLCYPYGSSEQDAVEKLQYDLYYIKNHTLLFYLAILLQTVEVILWRKGAR